MEANPLSGSVCSQGSSVRRVLEAINAEPFGIAFLVDDDGRLTGVMTDGDVRRFLLAGGSLEDGVDDQQLGDFVYATIDESLEEVLAKTSQKISIVPIVDSSFVPVDYFRVDRRIHIPIAMPDLKGREFAYVADAFLSSWISSKGKYVNRFESEFSAFCDCKYGVSTSNGTTALHLALEALDVGQGDEVIVPDLTFAATINAVIHSGATPVIVDIEEDSWCISPKAVEGAITENTRAVIPVHLQGQPCDMTALQSIARRHGLHLIEDCAQAHGARFAGRRVGSFGDVGCFSFYGNKILTTGEGGMCVTNSDKLNERLRLFRDHGMSRTRSYWHEVVGFNYRMTNLQAAVGCAQLERIEDSLASRKAIEEDYRKELSDVEFVSLQGVDFPGRERVIWLVTASVRGLDRGDLIESASRAEIDLRPMFHSLSKMELYRPFVHSCTTSQLIARQAVFLPTYLGIDVQGVVKRLERVCRQLAREGGS